jgi:MFS family permease
MYAASGMLLIPVTLLVFFGLREVKDPPYRKLPFWKGFAEIWSNPDIKGIMLIDFLLQFFYAWMIIYTPLYLYNTIGFSWTAIGVIFTVMLIPFPVLGAPLGRLADWHGEKRILTAGFIVMAISTGAIAFITDHNWAVWAVLLFFTRVGAASVEVMIETYFFKHVNAADANIISFSRMVRPIAYVVSPVVATILFLVFDTKGLFLFLGLLMLYGVRYTLSLKDTRPATV